MTTMSAAGLPQAEALNCDHCRQPISGEVVTGIVAGERRQFCCTGCRTVCEAIYESGLEGFYRRISEGEQLAPPPEQQAELAMYDLDAVQEEFVDTLGPQRRIELLVEGVHCAACVWLIEKSLKAQPGVLEARVNLTGRRLKLSWDNTRLRLSEVLTRLAQLGYAAVPFDPDRAAQSQQRYNRDLLYRMGFAAFGMMNMLWIAIALYSGADDGEFRQLFHWIGMALATPVLIYSGQPFFRGAVSGLRNLRPTMDLPIAIGATISYLYSCYVTIWEVEQGHVYFDTVVNFLFVILVGRFLESVSRRKALAATERLLDLQPKVARRWCNGEEEQVPVKALQAGDWVAIRSGDRIPVDGVVREGVLKVDESMLTGESEPCERGPGTTVAAGTINVQGHALVEVQATLRASTLGKIIALVEEAQASKAPIQRLSDRIVPWFVLATLSLSGVTFFLWHDAGFEFALMAATAVLIITCPCAFGLATPMSVAVASGSGAANGILIKNGEVLETLSDITDVVFDKTGTLTQGRLSVVSLRYPGGCWRPGEPLTEPVRELLALMYALEHRSEHPVARAIERTARETGCPLAEVADFHTEPGLGLRGRVGGRMVLIGNARWLAQAAISEEGPLKAEAETLGESGRGHVRLAVDGRLAALVELDDPLRTDAPALVADLREKGIRMTLLSGDRRSTAERVAAELGGMEVIAEVLPADKDRVIAALQEEGRRVVMVGDGVNDAPALVRADVGIALGSGTDVSAASADIVLLSDELIKVDQAIALSRRTLRTIRQNIAISFAYNLIMVPLAMAGQVTPLVAAITMPISSLLVIGNAARIRRIFR